MSRMQVAAVTLQKKPAWRSRFSPHWYRLARVTSATLRLAQAIEHIKLLSELLPALVDGGLKMWKRLRFKRHKASQRRVFVFGLTNGGEALMSSSVCGGSLVNVATSRQEDAVCIVGRWPSVERLPLNNKLRQTMMALRANNPNFVLDFGEAPISMEHEREIAAGHLTNQLIRHVIANGREYHDARRELTEIKE